MIRKGFKMKLYENMAEEYKKRHDNLWPEMVKMIHEYGGKNYSIFLDEESSTLFGYLEVEDISLWDKTAETEICKKWWKYMADIMETNADNSPIAVDFVEMFHLD
jgi:L-rhamnose mutarotase